MRKVLLVNEGYSNNLGDQAIKQSMESYLKTRNYQVDFMYLSNPSIIHKPKYKYNEIDNCKQKANKNFISKLKTFMLFFYWRYKFGDIIKDKLIQNDYDMIIIGGGQLIISSGSFYLSGFSTSLYWLTYYIKKYTNAKVILFSVGASAKFNFFEKFLYSKIFKRITEVYVRDKFSKTVIKNNFKIIGKVIPDIVFYNKKNISNTKEKKISLVSVANFDEVYKRYNKDSKSKIQYYNDYLSIIQKMEKEGYEIKLFYTTISDYCEVISFNNYIKQKSRISYDICKINSLEDLNKYFKEAHLVYSGRMHALILGYLNNCEILTFKISKKLESFSEFIEKNRDKDLQMEFNNLHF